MNALLPIRTESPGLNSIRATRGFHWWYPAIIDRMIAHPEWTKQDIARDLGVAYHTIYLVTSCDLFRAHLAKRREEISRAHDTAIGERLAKVATTGLDKILEHIESKPGQSIPLLQLVELSDKVLSRLGYGDRGPPPAAAVQVNVNANHEQSIRVSTQDLIEARNAIRATETRLGPLANSPVLELTSQVGDYRPLVDSLTPSVGAMTGARPHVNSESIAEPSAPFAARGTPLSVL